MGVGLPQYQVQILIALGLLGVYVGWRGGMQRMAGFYDMPSATKHLAYGLILGAFSAIFIDQLFISTVASTGVVYVEFILLMFFIGLFQALLFHFLLTRKGVRILYAPPTSGWTMGLGMGAIQASYLMIRMADPQWPLWYSGFNLYMIGFGVWVTFFMPALEAIIGSWQGSSIVEKKPISVMWQAGIFRGFILILVLLGITTQPILLLILPPAALYGFSIAEKKWLPSALIPSVRQEYERTIRKSAERAKSKANRQLGELVSGSEE
ncbi:MAG: hypothetical protein CMO20_03560 [Thermoplasmata archaeon]|nr:hypothetical protein [Thermoplasmata archaeon]